jgi:hypothetical protein
MNPKSKFSQATESVEIALDTTCSFREGSLTPSPKTGETAVISRGLRHFRQFLLRSQERGKSCKKPADVGVMTPGREIAKSDVDNRTDATVLPPAIVDRTKAQEYFLGQRSWWVHLQSASFRVIFCDVGAIESPPNAVQRSSRGN